MQARLAPPSARVKTTWVGIGRVGLADLRLLTIARRRSGAGDEGRRGALPGRSETLDDGHAAGLEGAAYAVRPGAAPKPARHDLDEATQHDGGERRVERHAEPETERNVSTHCRTGTWSIT
jgi:hypothetical protein